MTRLTDTQTIILNTAAQRADNIAMPLPKGLHGAAAKKVVTMMIGRGWFKEVNADTRKGAPLWRETGDGHGTTLVVTDAGLLAIRVEPIMVKTMAEIRTHAAQPPAPNRPTPRTGTKQAMLIEMLQSAGGATMEKITAATGWQAHSARGAMSGTLDKKLGLVVTSRRKRAGSECIGLGNPTRISPPAATSPSCMTIRDARTTPSTKAARAPTNGGSGLSIRCLGRLASWMAIQSPMRRELRGCADR